METTTNKTTAPACQKSAPAPIKPEQIRKRTRRPVTDNERETGAIICSQDLRGLSLLDAALDAWQSRQRRMGLALLFASALIAGSIHSQTVEVRPVANCEQANTPAECEEMRGAREVMNSDEFFAAYPDADEDDFAYYQSEAAEWIRKDKESQAAMLAAYLGGDVDGASAGAGK